ncbi:carbohydrate sulfotransferase 5-like [Amblyomma americanum]
MENVPLYTVWLEGTDFYKRNRFMSNLCEGGQACTSPSHMSAVCSRSSTRVFKFSRLYVSQVTNWLKRNPGLANSVRVIHLVRDPRAVYYSRRRLKWCTSSAECDKAGALCEQMRSDIGAFNELARQLPANRTQRLRFEDLVANTLNETVRLYSRLGLDFTSSVSKYLATRKSPKDAPDRWKKKLPKATLYTIEDVCYDVLEGLGYEFSVPQVQEEMLE